MALIFLYLARRVMTPFFIAFTLAYLLEDWGIRPDQVVDYLALVGDSSDNVPGVKGVGAKTAQKLLLAVGLSGEKCLRA